MMNFRKQKFLDYSPENTVSSISGIPKMFLITSALRNQPKLIDELCIAKRSHSTLPLDLYKYTPLSPKDHPLVRECRGIVVDRATSEVVAKPFSRFFNTFEMPETNDWKYFSGHRKEDGSCLVVYWYDGWRVNTLGSFGEGEQPWGKWFWSVFRGELSKDFTHVFEFCSLQNQVVKIYQEPTLFHLGTFDREGNEHNVSIGVQKPTEYRFADMEECRLVCEVIEIEALARGDIFEGFVLKHQDVRSKLKTKSYMARHGLANNGSVHKPERLIEFILSGEDDEICELFPYVIPYRDRYVQKIREERMYAKAQYDDLDHTASRKDFAISIQKHPLRSLFFAAKDTSFDQAWNNPKFLLGLIDEK